jgi:hypothetical protein
MMRRHSGSARLPSPRVRSPSKTTRVIPSSRLVVSFVSRPTTMLAVFCSGNPRLLGPAGPILHAGPTRHWTCS